MSFNDEQLGYMADMARRPRNAVCYCAWFPAGKCPHCPPHLTAADRIPLECPDCHNYPPALDLSAQVIHQIGCKRGAHLRATSG